MHILEHCVNTQKKLGKDFFHVHKWLDHFFGNTYIGTKHRRLRHHWEGIEKCREIWGNKAAEAARQHILDDLLSEGISMPTDNDIPKNENDYIKKGYW